MRTIIFVTFMALAVATCMGKSQPTNINLKPTLSAVLDNPGTGQPVKVLTICNDLFLQVSPKTNFHSAKLVSIRFSPEIHVEMTTDTLSKVQK